MASVHLGQLHWDPQRLTTQRHFGQQICVRRSLPPMTTELVAWIDEVDRCSMSNGMVEGNKHTLRTGWGGNLRPGHGHVQEASQVTQKTINKNGRTLILNLHKLMIPKYMFLTCFVSPPPPKKKKKKKHVTEKYFLLQMAFF